MFYRTVAVACAFASLVFVVGAALIGSTAANTVLFAVGPSFDAALIAFAWGHAASRPSLLGTAASALLVLGLIVEGTDLVAPVLPWLGQALRVTARVVLAAALVAGHLREPGVIAGAVVLALAVVVQPLLDSSSLACVVVSALFAGAAIVAEALQRTTEVGRARGSIEAWRQTGAGLRIVLVGEGLRAFGAVFLGLGYFQYERTNPLIALGQTIVLAAAMIIVAVGLWGMRASPAGRPWLAAARGLATWGALAAVAELVQLVRDQLVASEPWFRLTLDRLTAQILVGPLLAMAFIELGARSGVDTRDRSILAGRWYLGAWALSLASISLVSIDRRSELLSLIIIGLALSTIVSTLTLRKIAIDVRAAVSVGAANDTFGDEPAASGGT